MLAGNLVIVNASVESGSLVVLDKASGKEVWQAAGMVKSWSTPVLVELPGGGRESVVSVKGKVHRNRPGQRRGALALRRR